MTSDKVLLPPYRIRKVQDRWCVLHWVRTGPSSLNWGMYLLVHSPTFATWEQAMAFVAGRIGYHRRTLELAELFCYKKS